MAKLTYKQLNASFNRQMRVGEDDRVTLLKRVLAALGHPERHYRIIHIAGTNGKGSTGRMLAAILQEAGMKVGHFNSPAMVDDREQIQVNQQLISQADFVAAYQHIVAYLPVDIQPQDLTVFEWWTLIMLQYFATVQVDWAVIEVGLGGTNDATNCIAAPDLAVITHLALDHTRILGPTITDIATAKAGIIKAGTAAVILAPHQQGPARRVIERRAAAQGVPLVDSAAVVQVQRRAQANLAGQDLLVNSRLLPATTVRLNLLGDYQLDNLTTVLAAVDKLVETGLRITRPAVQRALAQVVIPGRLQVVAHQPTVILDGAHNPDGAHRLCQSIIHLGLANHPLALVVGFLKDKNIMQMVEQYRQLPAQVFVTTPDHPTRALAGDQLAQCWLGSQLTASGPQAVRVAKKNVGHNGTVIVTGSFYLIKEIAAQLV